MLCTEHAHKHTFLIDVFDKHVDVAFFTENAFEYYTNNCLVPYFKNVVFEYTQRYIMNHLHVQFRAIHFEYLTTKKQTYLENVTNKIVDKIESLELMNVA